MNGFLARKVLHLSEEAEAEQRTGDPAREDDRERKIRLTVRSNLVQHERADNAHDRADCC